MAEPDFTAHLLEQPLEPRAVATGLQAHDDRSSKLLVEAPHRSFVLVLQFQSDEFASFSFQITDRLLPCMKVNADIYCLHSASFQSPVKESREFTTHGEGGACFITSRTYTKPGIFREFRGSYLNSHSELS